MVEARPARNVGIFRCREVIEKDHSDSDGIYDLSGGRIIFADDLRAASRRRKNREKIEREKGLGISQIPDGNCEDD